MDTWSAFVVSPCSSKATNTLPLVVFCFCCDIKCTFSWKCLQLTMDLFLLFTAPLLRLMVILLYRNVWVVDHLRPKLPTELQVALVRISRKMLECSLCVDTGDPQDESEDSVGPVTCLPSFLYRNRLHAVIVVVFNHMPILVVVVEDLCVAKRANLLLFVGVDENPFFLPHPPHSLFRRLT
jgi:hypothetical protein